MKKSTQNILLFTISGLLFAYSSVYCYKFYQFDGSSAAFYLSLIFALGVLLSIFAVLLELFNPTK